MNEKDVFKRSVSIFIIGCLIWIGLGILLRDISYFIGFVLGFLINELVFLLIIKMTDVILQTSMSTLIVMMMFVVKLILYAIGFIISVKFKWVHIVGVFFGYMITKISIYLEEYIHKGGV